MDSQPRQADAEALASNVSTLLSDIRSAEAKLGRLLVEIQDRGVVELYGYRSLTQWFSEIAGTSSQAATKVVKRAQALYAGHQPDGTTGPPVASLTGDVALEGKLGSSTIDAIVRTLVKVPAGDRVWVERKLLVLAEQAGPAQVARAGARIIEHLDPGGHRLHVTELPAPGRELSLRRKRNGVWELRGRFDDETGTRTNALLGSLTEHHTAAGGTDPRFPAQRMGDAFSDAVDLALRSPDLPTQTGERAHVTVAAPPDDAKTGAGTTTPGGTGTMSAAETGLHACDAAILPAAMGGKSETPDIGRLKRLITTAHRRSLSLRDRGCAFPGCGHPPRHCQSHRIRHRADSDLTSLGNFVLLCPRHHRLLHRSGWQVRIAPDGLPEFLPPRYLDRKRRPRRNNLHPPLPFVA